MRPFTRLNARTAAIKRPGFCHFGPPPHQPELTVWSIEEAAASVGGLFYLGRLSGRDDRTYWAAVVKGRLAEPKTKAKAPDLYGSCAVFVTKNID
jgi:hypothetical protein